MSTQEILLFAVLMSGFIWAFYKLLTDEVGNRE